MTPDFDLAGELVMRCFDARTQAHILHLKTTSYAQHKALDEFYNEIVERADAFAEAFQGAFDKIESYSATRRAYNAPIPMLNDLRDWVQRNRSACAAGQTELGNLIDEILSTIDSALYKLRFLR